MKKILFLFAAAAVLCCSMRSDECITKDGYFRGKRLAGKVKIVDALADFNVRVVDALPDLNVKVVDGLANDPGEWQFVEGLPDFTVRFVDGCPDFTIRFVDNLPGVRRPCR